VSPARNPDWAEDELILALDLYLRDGSIDDRDTRVIELSELLNSLPIHTTRPDVERFRNPNGVALKLANFSALDPNYPGVGMRRGGRRDQHVWARFSNNRDELARLALAIRSGAAIGFPAVPEEDEADAEEGRLLYRRHRTFERDPRLRARKKAQARKSQGGLECEVCGFDFEATYGLLGHDFIECHHLIALSDTGRRITRLSDLALLCSNCHRMAHRRRPWPSIADLRDLIGSPAP